MPADNPFERLAANERWVWAAAVLFYGIGDAVTTLWGLSAGGVAEGGLLASTLLATFGFAGLVGVKVAIFGTFYLAWRILRTPASVAVPFALAGVGVGVTAWNLVTIVFTL